MAERNSYAQPMDFEYENKRGAVDPSSPFITSQRASQSTSSFSTTHGDLGASWRIQGDIDQRKSNLNASKRAFARYESPQKAEAPALRPPGAGQSVLFSHVPESSLNKKLPPKPTIWNTPRRSKEVIVDSSGGETPDTVNWNADSEATPDTPSMGLRKGIKNMFSSKKDDTISKELVRSPSKGSPSAGRGEVAKPYSNKIMAKVQKKREKEQVKRRRLLREAAESETEADTEVEQERQRRDKESKGFDVGGFFHYLESHPNLPNVLSFYAQLALNVFLVFGIMYLLYSFWSTIRSDVDKKSQEAMAEVLAEIAVCAKHWKDNQCDKGTILPALEAVCREWEKCMNKDHKSIGRARVSAHTFAEIFNSFIEPISWKAMVSSKMIVLSRRGANTKGQGFILVTVVLTFGVTNGIFALFRRNVAPQQGPYQSFPQVPPTPQRHPSWGMDPQYGFTPYSSQYALPPPQWGQPMGLEPAPSQGSQATAGSQGSPRKLRGPESPRKQKQLEL